MHGSDPFGELAEFLHTTQEQAGRQITGVKSAYIGYIVRWFPNNDVIVANPLGGTVPQALANIMPDGNNVGLPSLSPRIPLSTAFAGIANGINPVNASIHPGIVLAPMGGAAATSEDQYKGEQVLVLNLNNLIGYSACAFMLFNSKAISPALSIPVTNAELKPGEWLMVSPSGTHIHFMLSGDFLAYGMKTLDGGGNPQGGNTSVAAEGSITLQTVLAITSPTPSDEDGDIWLRSRNNVKINGLNLYLNSTEYMSLLAGTSMDLTATVGINLLASDVNLLSTNTIHITARNTVQITSVNGGSNALFSTDLTLTGATNITMNAQGIGSGGDATVQAIRNIALNAGNAIQIYAIADQVVIQAGTTLTQNAGLDLNMNIANNLNVTGQNEAIFQFNNDTTFLTGGIFSVTAEKQISIAVTSGTAVQNLTLHTDNGSINVTPFINFSVTAGGDVNISGLGAATLEATNNDVTISSANGGIVMSGIALNVTTVGSIHFDITKSLGSFFINTTSGGHVDITTGTLSMTAANDVGIVATSGTIKTISATGTTIEDQGGHINLVGASGSPVDNVMLAAFLTIFASHTHGGVMAGTDFTGPGPNVPPGYPYTSQVVSVA